MKNGRGFAKLTRLGFGYLALAIANIGLSAGAGWVDSFEQATQIAKKQGRPIFVDFSTSWCTICKQMDKTVFADSNIIARLDNYVKVKVDAEARNDLSNRYAITGYPTFLYLDPDGRIVERKEGGIRAQEMADALDRGWNSVSSRMAVAQAKATQDEIKNTAQNSRIPNTQVANTSQNMMPAQEEKRPGLLRNAMDTIRGRNNNRETAAAAPAPAPVPVINANDPKLGDSVYAMNASPSNSRSRFGSAGNAGGLRELAEATAQPGAIEEQESSKSTSDSGKEKLTAKKAESSESEDRTDKSEKPEIARAEKSEKTEQSKSEPLKEEEVKTAAVETEQIKLIAPVQMAKTDVSPAVNSRLTGISDNELPKPLLSRTSGQPTQAMAPAPTVSTVSASNDPLATIRRISGESVAVKPPLVVASATQAPATVIKTAMTDAPTVSADPVKQPEPAKTETDKPETAKSGVAAKPAEPAKGQSESKSNKSEETEKPAAGKSPSTFSKQSDIERWMDDADSKLVGGRKKEARAMYAKVVENDSKNESGKSDMAFIKMVSLIVDRDSDQLRREAYTKIKQFKARYPDSSHTDYYTLIRAILAVDLNEIAEAHNLLGPFAERFPESKYKKSAHEIWKKLPPVKKPSTPTSKKSNNNSTSKSKSKSSNS